MKKATVLLVLALVAAAPLSAAQQQKPKAPADSPAALKVEAPAPKAAPENPEKVIVTVNGEKIRERQVFDEVDKQMTARLKQMPAGWEAPQERIDMMRQHLRDQVKRGLVDETLVEQAFEKQGLKVTNDTINERIDEIAKSNNVSRDEFIRHITAQYGISEQEIKDEIRSALKIEALIEANLKDVNVTEADARKFYEENLNSFVAQEGRIRAKHILAGKRGITPEEKPAMLEKIKKAQARLKAGETFEDVARQMSDCPSGAKGGDLGFFGRNQMDPAFEKAAYDLEIGQTSDIVESSFGYHLIKRVGNIEFDEVRDNLIEYMKNRKKSEFWQDYRAKLTEAAKIEWVEGEEPAPPQARPQPQKAEEPAPADKPQAPSKPKSK